MKRTTVLMITALMVGGLVSCSDDEQTSSTTQDQTTVAAQDETTITTTAEDQSTTSATGLSATSTVTVTVRDVEDAVGDDLAGVLFSGDEPLVRNVVGGFGAAVESDPFTTTQVVRAPRYGPEGFPEDFDVDSDWPFVTDEPAMLEPGTYSLQLWLGRPPLCCYSAFVPGDPSDGGLSRARRASSIGGMQRSVLPSTSRRSRAHRGLCRIRAIGHIAGHPHRFATRNLPPRAVSKNLGLRNS